MNLVNPLLDSILTAAQQVKPTIAENRPAQAITEVEAAVLAQGGRELKADSRLNDMPGRQQYQAKPYGYSPSNISPSTITRLNEAAKIIADLMYQFPVERDDLFLKLTPLDRQLFLNSTAFPLMVRNTLEQSGLFYHSHLARWYRGDYPIKRLREDVVARLATIDVSTLSLSDALVSRCKTKGDLLNAIERFQLELLSSPWIKLKGEITPGVNATIIVISNTMGEVVPGAFDDKPLLSEDPLSGWRLAMRLENPGFGVCDIDVAWMHGTMHVALLANSSLLLEFFRRDQASLKELIKENGINSLSFHAGTMTEGQAGLPFEKLFRVDLILPTQGGIDHVISEEYGSENARILAEVQRHHLMPPIHPELMGLLSQVSFDRKIETSLYLVLFFVASWVVEQMPFFET